MDTVSSLLKEFIKGKDSVPISFTMGSTIDCMNLEISLDQGRFRSKMQRHSRFDFYTLPFYQECLSERSTCFIDLALQRAIALSTHIEDFNHEYLFIQSQCLIHRYPLHVISEVVQKFFQKHDPLKSNFKYNQSSYATLRRTVLQADDLEL